MGRNNHRPGSLPLLALLLLLTLGTLGTAYGAWTQSLVVSGSVTTGNLSARWVRVSCSDEAAPAGPGVATPSLTIDPSDASVAIFQLSNGYPGYEVTCSLKYENNGTVPWVVQGHTILAGANLSGCSLTGYQTKTLSCDQMEIEWGDGIGSWVRPKDGQGSALDVLIKAGSAPGSSYGFTVLHQVGL